VEVRRPVEEYDGRKFISLWGGLSSCRYPEPTQSSTILDYEEEQAEPQAEDIVKIME
jgi:hypothetical protein